MTQSENQPIENQVDPQASSELNPATDAPQYRNDGSDYLQQRAREITDALETRGAGATPTPPDSPSSASDAGLDDAARDANAGAAEGVRDLTGLAGQPLDDELTDELESSDLGEGLPDEPREIPMTDLADPLNPPMSVRTPELSDFSAPGELDIEELDEDALSDTDIPRDALLDPIEE